MALAPRPFLTAGRPRYTAEEFSQYNESFSVWEVTLVQLRRWCSDLRLRNIRPACAIVICGSSAPGGTSALLYCSVLEACSGSTLVTELMDCLGQVPVLYTPKEVYLRYAAESAVLDSLKALAGQIPQDLKVRERVENEMVNLCKLRQSGSPGVVSFHPFGDRGGSDLKGGFDSTLHEIAMWMVEERKMFPDISLRPLPLNACPEPCNQIAALAGRFPFLSSQRMAPQEPLPEGVNVVCAAFSTSSVNAFPHVIVVQRPFVPPPPEDNQLAPRPQQPQPVGVEFHLHKFVGDAVFVKSALARPFSVETYEDLLHEDGEVYVQFGPVEGSAFDDIEFVHNAELPNCEGWGATVGVGSDYPRTCIPRVIFNKPGGTIERKTPVDSPKMTVVGEIVDEAMMRSAVAAVEHFCTVLFKGGTTKKDSYDINWDLAVLRVPETPPLVCNFCGRRREVMKRCGGCKVACYCCAGHQTQDWKGNHRKECKWLKISREDYPLCLGERLDAEEMIKEYMGLLEAEQTQDEGHETALDPAALAARGKSSVATFYHLLKECGVDLQTGGPLVVHLLNVENTETFISELARWPERPTRQIRIVLIQSDASGGVQNDVFGLDHESEKFELLPPTGALGDVWHTSGVDSSKLVVLTRLYSGKYITLQTGHSLMQPEVVLSLGSTKYEGMTFFHSATSILADSYVGKVPVAVAEPHFVTAQRTLGAIIGRLEMTTVTSQRPQSSKQTLTWMCKQSPASDRVQSGIAIQRNHLVCPSPVPASLVVRQCKMESLPRVPLHVNAYYFLLLPVTAA